MCCKRRKHLQGQVQQPGTLRLHFQKMEETGLVEFINDLPGLRIGVAPFAFGLVDFLVATMTTVMYRNLVPPGMAWWRGMVVCFLAARGE